MIMVMFNDSEGTFPPIVCGEGNAEALCEDLSFGPYEAAGDDEEESDEAK